MRDVLLMARLNGGKPIHELPVADAEAMTGKEAHSAVAVARVLEK
jgi:hypothetical protein